MPIGWGERGVSSRIRSSRGRGGGHISNHDKNGDDGGVNTRTPERPRQQRKVDQDRSPVFRNHRLSRTGRSTTAISNSNANSSSAGADFSTSPSSTAGTGGNGATPQRGRHASGSGSGHEEGGVRVVVRVRPLSDVEEARGVRRTMRCCNPKSLEFMSSPTIAPGGSGSGSGGGGGGGGGIVGENGGGSRAYSFDLCAHEGFTQEEMFTSCGLVPLLSAAVNGYAGTVFAYGATGAGKTYTMSGREKNSQGEDNGAQGRSRNVGVRKDVAGRGGEMDGLVPRSIRYLFQRIASLPSDITMRVRASFYEIYNEFVYDLLAQSQRHPLPVRYDVKRGFFVQGLFEVEIRNLRDIMAVVDEGNSSRRVSSHLLNTESSRSHSLLTLYLHSEAKDAEDGHLVKTFGKVSFVDLAGSERLKKSKTANEKETASINKSLMTLGKVISALCRRGAAATAAAAAASSAPAPSLLDSGIINSTPSSPGDTNITAVAAADPSEIWVPYRDSTLTKLLMDSLGGSGLTLMVACVSPSARHAEESAATLNYAARARNIRNRPIVRIDARERLINALRREIGLLREENELLRGGKLVPANNAERVRNAAALVGGAVHSPRGWSDKSFTPPLVALAGEMEAGVADAGRGRVGENAAIVDSKSKQQQREVSAASEIGKASRDVAALLRKYEEECHRLTKEAAIMQHTELEIGKQTRMALMENDALSRMVERLQKSFATDEHSPSAPPEERFRDKPARSGVPSVASLGVQNDPLHDEQPSPAGSTSNGVDTSSLLSPTSVVTRVGDNLGKEILHLRRVNEALVERVESMERTHLKTTTGSKGGASWVGGGGGGKKTVERGGGGGGGGGARRTERSGNGQVATEAARRAGGRGRAGTRNMAEAGRGGEIASRRATETVRPDGVTDSRGVGPTENPEPRRRAMGQIGEKFTLHGRKGGRSSGQVSTRGGASAANAARDNIIGGRRGGGGGTGAITGSHLIMNSGNRSARVDATRRPQQRRDLKGRPIALAVGVNEGSAGSKLVAGQRRLLHPSTRSPTRPREAERAGRVNVGKGEEETGPQRAEGQSRRPGGLGGDSGGGVFGGEPCPASPTAHQISVVTAAAGDGDGRNNASGVARLPEKEEGHIEQEGNDEQPLREEDGGGEEVGVKYEEAREARGATAGSFSMIAEANRTTVLADTPQPTPERSSKAADESVSTAVDATVVEVGIVAARETAQREDAHRRTGVIDRNTGGNGAKGLDASPL